MKQSYLHIIMYNLECQRDTFQRYTFDLWDREWRHALLLGARVKLVADTGLGTTSTTAPLGSIALRNEGLDETTNLSLLVKSVERSKEFVNFGRQQ